MLTVAARNKPCCVPKGYLVLESLKINRFSCFEELKLSNLRRINVVVGDNASGKTTLLEAIFCLAARLPEVTLRTSTWRGSIRPPAEVKSEKSGYEAIWKYLFSQLDISNPIKISGTDSQRGRRTLDIQFADKPLVALDADVPEAIYPIMYEWTVGKKKYKVTARLDNKQHLNFDGDIPPSFPIVFLSPTNPNPGDDADRLSELAKKLEDGKITAEMRKHFEYIESISTLKHLGQAVIFAKVKWLSEMVPLGSVSSGIKKLASILLAIAANPKGVVLVDEIENGLYWKTYKKVWATILSFAKEYDVQLFVTTHSQGFLDALEPTIEGKESEFVLLRSDNQDGISTVERFGGQSLAAALRQDAEVR